MGRWIAIGSAPGWGDITKFGADLGETSKWRLDPQTTITTVIALADGRVVAECHGPKQQDFEAWLQKQGVKVESLTPIKHLAKTGNIWKVS